MQIGEEITLTVNRGALDDTANGHDDRSDEDAHAASPAITYQADKGAGDDTSKGKDSRHDAEERTARLPKV